MLGGLRRRYTPVRVVAPSNPADHFSGRTFQKHERYAGLLENCRSRLLNSESFPEARLVPGCVVETAAPSLGALLAPFACALPGGVM